MAQQSKRKQLKALFAQIPDDADIVNILFDLTDQADRTAAIVGAAILEDRLRRTLSRYFPGKITDNEKDELLFYGENRPLSNFDAKVRMAYCHGYHNHRYEERFRCDKTHQKRFRSFNSASFFRTTGISLFV